MLSIVYKIKLNLNYYLDFIVIGRKGFCLVKYIYDVA